MTFASLLTQRCTIERKTSIKNEYGHIENTWATVESDVHCRIDPMFVTSPFLSQTPNGQITGNDYVGYFFPSANIQVGDRITWQNIHLFARPINYSFGSSNSAHHLEVMFGLQET